MTNESFPLRGIFADLRYVTLDPPALYSVLQQSLVDLPSNTCYLAGPITSGGAARAFKQPDAQIANMRTMSEVAKRIVRNGIPLIVPSHLGKRKKGESDWDEVDYNYFWSMGVLPGTPPEQFINLYHDLHNLDKYMLGRIRNRSLPYNERAQAYEWLGNEMLQWLNVRREGLRPIGGMIRMPDANNSLGGKLEGRIATSLGIPRSILVFGGLTGTVYKSLYCPPDASPLSPPIIRDPSLGKRVVMLRRDES